MLSQKSACTSILIAASFTIAKTWNQPKCPQTDERIGKVWYIYSMEYYSAIKYNKTLAFAIKWSDMEDLLLSEVSQAMKERYCMYPLNIRYPFFTMEIKLLEGIKAVKIVINAEDSMEQWERGRDVYREG